MSTVVKDLGAVSAYAYAVEKGYTGTEAEFAELMADYAGVGQRAEDAAESALNSKTAAQTAATTATNKASEATTAAQTATTKAQEAIANAEAAARDASQAMAAESTATAKASEATTAAATATGAATTATTAKDDAVSAKTAAETAQGKAETAAQNVSESAAQIQTNKEDITELKSGFTQLTTATAEDVGKALKVKTVADGKVTEWEFGEAGGGGGAVTETITGSSVTFSSSDTKPIAMSVNLESDIPDTSGATPSNPVSITGITSETITVNGVEKVVSLSNPVGKGTWNVLTGEVTDERPVIDFTAELVHSLAKATDNLWAMLIKFSNAGLNVKPNGILACTHYPVYKSGAIKYPVIRYVNGTYYLYDTSITENNLQAAKEYIANLGAKFILDVAEPVTYAETPEAVTLVKGENTVAVSTGEMSLTYAVDIKGYVDGKVASVEDTANEALDTANGLDARVTANTELSESNEQNIYKYRTKNASNTGTGSASSASTTRWGFYLGIDESIEKCYSITFTPTLNTTATEYTATRWKKDSGTLANHDILTKVTEITKPVGESVTFEKVGVNEFISINKSGYRTGGGDNDHEANVREAKLAYINETTGEFITFSGLLSGDFSITFCKPVKDDSMPLYGKKVALVGDSITEKNGRANTNHAMYLNQWTGAQIQNLGVGGTGFSTNNKYKDRIANIKADTEIIGVAASLNDMRNTVGTASDTAESETVCGYANEFFDLLLTSFPSVPIVCYSEGPWESYRPGVTKSDEYMAQMKQICLNKGIAWDDGLYRGCALRPWIQANREALYKGESGSYIDVVDNIHPNSAGQKYIAIYLKGLFEKYVR